MVKGYSEILKTKFKFINQPPGERKIKISYERRHSDEWILALQSPSCEVCVKINYNAAEIMFV